MELFDKQYVYFEWDDKLNNAEVLVADELITLKERIENGETWYLCAIEDNESKYFPFKDVVSEEVYKYVYYDPLYVYKYAYYKEGKTIEWYDEDKDKWIPITVEPLWGDDNIKYRIQKEQDSLCTYRQLAEWLAKGNGEFFYGGDAHTNLSYPIEKADVCLDKPYMIRKWNDKEWNDPFLSYMKEDN